MTERKVVIKLKTGGASSPSVMTGRVSAPAMVTEWNINRIAGAAGVAVIVIGALAYGVLRRDDGGDTAVKTSSASVEATEASSRASGSEAAGVGAADAGKAAASVPTPKPLAKGVARAQLSRGVRKQEPVGTVVSPVRVEADRGLSLFFFTQLVGMKGKKVIHEWIYEGKVTAQKAAIVSGNDSHFYSSKLLTDKMLGRWTVQLKDGAGRVLYAESFVLAGPEG